MRRKRLTDDLLSIYQTAALLNRSVSTIYNWTERGDMPAPVKFGGRLRWRRSDIQAWAEAGFPHRDHEPTKTKAKA